MVTIKLTKDNNNRAISAAIAVLRQGGIIAYPTETFYGLGAKFDIVDSLRRIYEIKKRPQEKAMPVIIGDKGLLGEIVSPKWLAQVPRSAESLIRKFWPGPLTLLLPAKEWLSEYLTAGTGMIAVRIPGESFALHLAKQAGFPIIATSANLSGMPPAADAATVITYFGDKISLLIDGGRTPAGLPSTIVDASGQQTKIIREGAVRTSEILQG